MLMPTPSARSPMVFPSTTPTLLATPTTLESSPALTPDMDAFLATELSETVDTTVDTVTSATLATAVTTTASVRPTLMLMPTLSVRSPTVFPSTTPTPPAIPTMLESSLALTTATDVSLATELLETVASMVDTTMEPTLDIPVPTTANFTLSSHPHLLEKITQLLSKK